jgi:sec-independent protein translocase protein TatA
MIDSDGGRTLGRINFKLFAGGREFPMGIGWQQVLIVAVVALLLFGSNRLPTLMRDMGRSLNEFKRGMKDSTKTDNDDE